MIGLIGFQDDIIGFGLTGIKHVRELPYNASKDNVLSAIGELGSINVLFISEELYKKIAEEKVLTQIFCVQIPKAGSEVDISSIEKLARETLGISL